MNFDWASLLVGILIGAAVMWAFDWLFYGRRNLTGARELGTLRQRAEAAEDKLEESQTKLVSAEHKLQATSKDLVMARADAKEALAKQSDSTEKMNLAHDKLRAAQVENEKLKGQLASVQAEIQRLRSE